jgi:hypothetical protein
MGVEAQAQPEARDASAMDLEGGEAEAQEQPEAEGASAMAVEDAHTSQKRFLEQDDDVSPRAKKGGDTRGS